MEIMTTKEFWSKNPAPDTIFYELDSIPSIVVGEAIDPETQDPDDIVMISYKRRSTEDKQQEEMVLVKSWGSWDNHKNLLDIHKLGVQSLKEEGHEHKCGIGL